MAIVSGPTGSVQADMRLLPDQAVNPYLHRNTGRSDVFSGDVQCAPGDCRLVVLDGAHVLGAWLLADLHRAIVLDTPGAVLYIDTVTALPPLTNRDVPNLRSLAMHAISRTMPYFTGLVALPAFGWLIWAKVAALKQRRPDPVLVLLWALAAAVLLRVALLGLLDATSIALQFRYESPVLGVWIAFVAIAVSDVGKTRGDMRPPSGF